MELCQRSVLHWFDWWAWTYDPRLVSQGKSGHLPFDLFPRQRDMMLWLDARIAKGEDGLLEKSRDVGFTYGAAGYVLHRWLFCPGFKSTFGSRNVDLVDKIGQPDSIFEKVRIMMRALPRWMLPEGFNSAVHDNYKRIVNPATGDTITGEGGDEMGRGGRCTLYVLDEAAFMDRADRVEASTSASSDVRIWASSANGTGNLFFRKRTNGGLRPDQIFRFHWSDDPRKDQAWAEKKKREQTEEWVFASEYDIDYTASVEGIAIPGKWVEAAKRIKRVLAENKLVLEPDTRGIGGQDVGAGKARSVFIPRFGPIVLRPSAWRDPDTTETALRALDEAQAIRLKRSNGAPCTIKVIRFDEPGVGKGVLSALKRHGREGLLTVPVNTGLPPSETTWPDGKKSEEKFGNLKAELWWLMRERFKCTYEMVLFLEGKEGGERHELSELISLPDDTEGPDCTRLATELSNLKWGRNEKGKIVIETKAQLRTRGASSPDYADALALTFDPDSSIETWLRAFA